MTRTGFARALTRLRLLGWMPLVSILLIGLVGLLAMSFTTTATHKSESIHLQDRQSLQGTLGGLGTQYVLFSLKEGLDYASTGSWNLRPNDPTDTARLQSFVSHAVLLNYGAAVVSLSAAPLSTYAAGPGVPPPSDPGYKPMIAALLAAKPDVSSVMTVSGGIHVVAMGVPITVDGQPRAVFVGFVRLDTSALETYVRALHYGHTGQTYVVDSGGTVVASTDSTKIGKAFLYTSALHGIAAGRSASFVDARTHDVVSYSAFGVGGWGGATVQSASEFYGPLRSGQLRIELAIVALLVVAAMIVLVLNYKREVARRQYHEQVAYQAAHDGLTGLFNRSILSERLVQALARAKQQASDVAVLYLDLDAFKPVNDNFGHAAGDSILVEMADRLRRCTRPADIVGRMGGDEFAIVIEDLHSPSQVEPLTRRIIDELSRPYAAVHSVGVSVGVAYASQGNATPEDLMRDADLAMYRAKDSGGNRDEWAEALGVR